MTLVGGVLIGCCIGFFIGAKLMRERMKCGLQSAVSLDCWAQIRRALERGDA